MPQVLLATYDKNESISLNGNNTPEKIREDIKAISKLYNLSINYVNTFQAMNLNYKF